MQTFLPLFYEAEGCGTRVALRSDMTRPVAIDIEDLSVVSGGGPTAPPGPPSPPVSPPQRLTAEDWARFSEARDHIASEIQKARPWLTWEQAHDPRVAEQIMAPSVFVPNPN